MQNSELDIVTGAFGFTGRYIAKRLLGKGRRVKTITGHPDRANPFGSQIEAEPYNFEYPARLTESLEGASRFFVTYWIRFPHGEMTYEKAVENTRTLIRCAKDAGIRRLVYISITNPSEDSPLPYFSGKARIEKAIRESGLSYAIIRPTVLFGDEGILINNIAYLLKHSPMFAVPGKGDYKLQPIYVDDLAEIAVNAGDSDENAVIDAVGPETYAFDELVRMIKNTVHGKARIVHMNPALALALANVVGKTVGDLVLTEDEVKGLMANLLISDQPPTGSTKLSEWVKEHADDLGARYLSELAKHYR